MKKKEPFYFSAWFFFFHLHMLFFILSCTPNWFSSVHFPSCHFLLISKKKKFPFFVFLSSERAFGPYIKIYLNCSFKSTPLHPYWKDEREEIKRRKHVTRLFVHHSSIMFYWLMRWGTHCWFPLRGFQCTNKIKCFYFSTVCTVYHPHY